MNTYHFDSQLTLPHLGQKPFIKALRCALALRLAALQLISRAGSAAQGSGSFLSLPSIYETAQAHAPVLFQHAGLLSVTPSGLVQR